jgi:hypothetical protein
MKSSGYSASWAEQTIIVLISDPKLVLQPHPKYGEHPTSCILSKAVKTKPYTKKESCWCVLENQ